MDRHRRIRIRHSPEDAGEHGDEATLVAWEAIPRPKWHCEHCGMVCDGHEDNCVYCGRLREDGWD